VLLLLWSFWKLMVGGLVEVRCFEVGVSSELTKDFRGFLKTMDEE
jgi:hypothetical protein